MSKEATQTGVSALEGGFEEDPRAAAYAAADAEREEETTPLDNADGEEQTEEQDTELKPVEEAQEEEQAAEEEPDVEEDAEPTEEPEEEMRTIKVDGVETQVPLSTLIEDGIRTRQKESAADRRLEEATRLMLKAEQMQAQAPAAPVSEEAAKPQLTQDEKVGRLREIRRKIRVEGVATAEEYDTLEAEEFSLEAELREDSIRASRDVDVQTRQQQEARESANKMGAAIKEKYPTFDTDVFFADDQGRLFKDPQSGQNVFNPDFAQWLSEKPQSYGMSMLYSTDQRDIEMVMNDYYASKSPVADLSAKRTKKRSIDNIETAQSRAAPKKKKGPETNSEYVARLKRERNHGSGPDF